MSTAYIKEDNLEELDENIKRKTGMYLLYFIRDKRENIKGYKYHETCDKFVEGLRESYGHIEGAGEWFDALDNTIWIAGAGPRLVTGNLRKCVPFKYKIHAKVVETYINFYFYFFKDVTVTNDSMKIAAWLEQNLTLDEYNKIISRFPNNERKCLSESLLQYKMAKNTIKKLSVTFVKDNWGVKWTAKSDDGKKIIFGISSDILYAKSDSFRCAHEKIEVHPECKFIFE